MAHAIPAEVRKAIFEGDTIALSNMGRRGSRARAEKAEKRDRHKAAEEAYCEYLTAKKYEQIEAEIRENGFTLR